MEKVELIKSDKFSFVLFNDVYNKKDFDYIWEEITFLSHEEKMSGEKSTSGALDATTLAPLKNNRGIWLEEVYSNRKYSNYFNVYKKPLIECRDILKSYIEYDYNLNAYFKTVKDCTLLSYYENGDEYKKHNDFSSYTFIYWTFKEPKKFRGGNLRFDDINYDVEVNNNMAILFPSWANHSVIKVEIDPEYQNKGFGRFAFSTFLH